VQPRANSTFTLILLTQVFFFCNLILKCEGPVCFAILTFWSKNIFGKSNLHQHLKLWLNAVYPYSAFYSSYHVHLVKIKLMKLRDSLEFFALIKRDMIYNDLKLLVWTVQNNWKIKKKFKKTRFELIVELVQACQVNWPWQWTVIFIMMLRRENNFLI
jgi:hypothetical protein